jgi:predicted transcriptional regulator
MPEEALKLRKSNKSPAVKAAVLIHRANGKAKREIARDLGISRPTVDVIISEANLDQQLESGRVQCSTLIPESIRVVKHRLAQNSENAAFKLLEGIGVLGREAKQNGKQPQIELTQAVNIMFKQQEQKNQADTPKPAIEVQVEKCPPPATQQAEPAK